jgi:hypothetical protein
VYIYFKRQRVGGRVKRPERKGGKQGRKWRLISLRNSVVYYPKMSISTKNYKLNIKSKVSHDMRCPKC